MGVITSGMRLTAARLNAATGAGEEALKVLATTGTMASSSFVDLPGVSATSITFTKYATGSELHVAMKMMAFSDAGSTGLRLGVRVGGVDYDVALGYFTTANVYGTVSGFAQIAAGLAAGTYTIQARWKRPSGSGVINTSSGISELDMSVREVGV